METQHRERSQSHDHLQNSLDRLELAVAGIQNSDSFRRYLDVQARFHKYSPNNVLLIMAQRPAARKVAGYRTWQSLDRQVRQGEQAIRIIAPTTYKRKETETEEEAIRLGFRAVPVFDISQTEGKPLPSFQVPLLYSDDGEELYTQLEDLAAEERVGVHRGSERLRGSHLLRNPNMMGYYLPEQQTIYLRDAAQLQMSKTLAHELGHHFSQHTESNPSTETEAEGISYVVLAHFGLDSGERSFPYVATWAKDRHTLRSALGQIQRVSGLMIDRLEGHGGVPDEPQTAEPVPGPRA